MLRFVKINMFVLDRRVPDITAWLVLRLRKEKRPLIWMVAANIFNKQSRTAHKGLSSSLGIGRGANNFSAKNSTFLRNGYMCLGPRLTFGMTLALGMGRDIWCMECKNPV